MDTLTHTHTHTHTPLSYSLFKTPIKPVSQCRFHPSDISTLPWDWGLLIAVMDQQVGNQVLENVLFLIEK